MARDLPSDVLLAKAQTIERATKRAREALAGSAAFGTDLDAQDIAVLNIVRVCEAALDMSNHIIRVHSLGVSTNATEAFKLLEKRGYISPEMANNLSRMASFRNLAVHDYGMLDYDIVAQIVRVNLDEVLAFSAMMVRRI
jgi:uncharacterized protein YutE (UPF0331/DUF86 family)